MKTGLLRDVSPRTTETPFSEVAWLWTNVGEGKLYPLLNLSRDSWVICTRDLETPSTLSFSCTPGSIVYYFATPSEKESYEATLRQTLAEFRRSLSK